MKPVAALLLVIAAGNYDRVDTPMAVALRLADLGLTAEEAAKAQLFLVEQGPKEPTLVLAQWDDGGNPAAAEGSLVFVLPGTTPKGATRTFKLAVKRNEPVPKALSAEVQDGKRLQVAAGGKPVLRYNFGLMTQFPDKASKFDRAGYFHPLWAPSGEEITGDFNPNHAHHRGLWFAWVKADAGPVKANFWEIQEGRGKVVNKAIAPIEGPAFAGFVAHNDWLSADTLLLKETLRARAYAAPTQLRIFDLDDRQEAADADVVLGKIHYGGLGFRGRDDWDGPKAPLDALTSEGKIRANANQTNARWIDYTGPLGKEGWGGILVIEHPSNPRYPNRLRVHPTMCFFSTTLCQTEPYTIKRGEPLELRYRIVLHDGKPDPSPAPGARSLAERLAADYVTPPTVTLRKEP